MLIYGIKIDESIGLPLFFIVGLYIALSPCLFPIMPLTIFRVLDKTTSNQLETTPSHTRRQAFQWVILLTSGIVFAFAGASIVYLHIWQQLGLFLTNAYRPLTYLLGILLILTGILFLSPRLGKLTFGRIPVPQRVTEVMQKETYRNLDLFILGMGYSIIALPCAFPAFIVLLALVTAASNVIFTSVGMTLFSIGVFLPYFLLIFFPLLPLTSFIRKHYRVFEGFVGILVMTMGLLFLWPLFGGPTLFLLS
ncbi:MAG: cytochrome c biogenesis protein CcdA [Candidatus Heimdallarchaeota archaeon]